MAIEPVLKLENVSFEREHKILDNINWQINSGENWVLMGLNGAGKTTLLSLIYGNFLGNLWAYTSIGSNIWIY